MGTGSCLLSRSVSGRSYISPACGKLRYVLVVCFFVNVICGALQVLPIVSIYFEVPNELVNCVISSVDCYPQISLILVRIERAYATFLVINSNLDPILPSCLVSKILQVFCSENDPNPNLPKFWGCFLWTKSPILGAVPSENPRLISHENYFPSIPTYVFSVPQPQRHRQGRTDNFP